MRGGNILLKTFLVGIVLGAVAAAGGLYAIPVIDQHREPSILTVETNGGTSEAFHINIPMDRIAIGAPGRPEPLPAGMQWPDDELFANVRSELFKVRNARDTVVGVAARTAVAEDDAAVIDWMIHLPARGTMFFSMEPDVQPGAFRNGAMSAGSREFSQLRGQLTERWVADTSGDVDAPAGRLQLEARYLGRAGPPE